MEMGCERGRVFDKISSTEKLGKVNSKIHVVLQFDEVNGDLDMEDSGLEVNSSWFARGGCKAKEAFPGPSSPPSSRRTP